MLNIPQVSYRLINSQYTGSDNQTSENSSIESSHIWTDLINQGVYEFIVVATTSEGPGEAANLMYDTQRSKQLNSYSVNTKLLTL